MRLKKMCLSDFWIVFLISFIASLLIRLVYTYESVIDAYSIGIISISFFVAFSWHLIRKIGIAIFAFVLISIFSYNIPIFGVTGIESIVAIFFTGVAFELIFVGLSTINDHEEWNTVISLAISIGLLPVFESAAITHTMILENINLIINLSILSSFMAAFGAIFFSMTWLWLRARKFVIRLRLCSI